MDHLRGEGEHSAQAPPWAKDGQMLRGAYWVDTVSEGCAHRQRVGGARARRPVQTKVKVSQ